MSKQKVAKTLGKKAMKGTKGGIIVVCKPGAAAPVMPIADISCRKSGGDAT